MKVLAIVLILTYIVQAQEDFDVDAGDSTVEPPLRDTVKYDEADVLELNDENWETELARNPNMLVEFFAPWW
jgi:hypothetical protein